MSPMSAKRKPRRSFDRVEVGASVSGIASNYGRREEGAERITAERLFGAASRCSDEGRIRCRFIEGFGVRLDSKKSPHKGLSELLGKTDNDALRPAYVG